MKQFFVYALSVFLLSAMLVSCGKKEEKLTENKEKEKTDTSKKISGGSPGKDLFYMKSAENNIACADCHSDGTNTSNPLTKYFSNIQGASKRTSTFMGKFKGEEVALNAGGATLCWQEYMRMKTPLTPEQIQSLNSYYTSVAGKDSSSEIKYETIALPVKDKAKLKGVQSVIIALKGDAVKGEQTFKNACAFCHGENSTVKKVPSMLEDFEGNVKSITFNVRLGDGAMPFFHAPALSDQDIADVAAYIMQTSSK